MPHGILFLLGVVSLILLGPLRDLTLSTGPAVATAAAFTLFVLPGSALLGLLSGKTGSILDRPAEVPIVFALSTGIFGFLAFPPLLLRWRLETYLLACAVVVALSLVGLFLLALRKTGSSVRYEVDGLGKWLWLPMAASTAVLALLSRKIFHPPGSDTWAYLMYVQKFLGLDRINGFAREGFSRTTLSSWLLEQASLSGISGIDPVPLVLQYLSPALVVVSVLAFYALALVLFENKTIALFSACLATLFFLVQLEASYQSLGNYFVGRIAEDKFVTRFIFLPVALSLAIQYLRGRSLRALVLFALVCWSATSVHPIGLVLIAISMTGFGLVHLTANIRSRRAWTSFVALGAATASIGVPPLIYLLVTGSSFPSVMTSKVPAVEDALLSRSLAIDRLIDLGDGKYIMDPSFLLDPVIFISYVLGVPFLVWKAKRSLAAQLLLGMLLFSAALVYIPPLAAAAGAVVGPWTLWRLAWPIPLASVLAVGWMSWGLLRYLGGYAEKFRFGSSIVPLLPLLVVIVLIAASGPTIWAGARSIDRSGEISQSQTSCTSPTFSWMQGELTEPDSVILAPDKETSCFSAYMPEGVPVGYRSVSYQDTPSDTGQDPSQASEVPQIVSDKQEFFDAVSVDSEMVASLRRYAVDYVLISANSPLNTQLQHLGGFTAMNNPGSRYRVYEVNRSKLADTALSSANGSLNRGDYEAALEVYKPLLQSGADERFLAYLGTGQAYAGLDQPLRAAASYEQAIQVFPESAAAYSLLAEAYTAAGEPASARPALEKAVSLSPQEVELHFELGNLLLKLQDKQGALGPYREVVERFPEVPNYRLKLGKALNMVGRFEAADVQFRRAIQLDPLSPQTHGLAGQINLSTGRPKKAAEFYKEALEIDPDNPKYSLQLGLIYSELSGKENDTNEFFGMAEEKLREAYSSRSSTRDQRTKAQFTLGKLYERHGEEAKSAAAYERALKANPDLAPARQRLEELRKR
ncbi:MAG: tetratricopeptide repeat protein [Rubrobacteraceae bacterium]